MNCSALFLMGIFLMSNGPYTSANSTIFGNRTFLVSARLEVVRLQNMSMSIRTSTIPYHRPILLNGYNCGLYLLTNYTKVNWPLAQKIWHAECLQGSIFIFGKTDLEEYKKNSSQLTITVLCTR
jgi:hypothetical protein